MGAVAAVTVLRIGTDLELLADLVLMMMKTMNKEIKGTSEMKLWFWWCNGGECERGGVPMPPLIQLTERA